jgi:hypothetical protein
MHFPDLGNFQCVFYATFFSSLRKHLFTVQNLNLFTTISYEQGKRDRKIVVTVGSWSLGLTVLQFSLKLQLKNTYLSNRFLPKIY